MITNESVNRAIENGISILSPESVFGKGEHNE